jgi:hypothetical protein
MTPVTSEAVSELQYAIRDWVWTYYRAVATMPATQLSGYEQFLLADLAPRRENRTWSEALMSGQQPLQVIRQFVAAVLVARTSLNNEPDIEFPFVPVRLLEQHREMQDKDLFATGAEKCAWRVGATSMRLPFRGDEGVDYPFGHGGN